LHRSAHGNTQITKPDPNAAQRAASEIGPLQQPLFSGVDGTNTSEQEAQVLRKEHKVHALPSKGGALELIGSEHQVERATARMRRNTARSRLGHGDGGRPAQCGLAGRLRHTRTRTRLIALAR
jgi:hypothetical protein